MVEDRRSANPNLVLAFLLLTYIFNFLDRQILGILAGSIMKDLDLNDAQFGAIGGIAFALLYSVLAIPLAMLADRTSRARVIAGSLAVWSGFTALCGTATGFTQLFFYRLGVSPIISRPNAARARWRSFRSASRLAWPGAR
jgi:MFS family permease